jgi:Lon protease-like protein
MQDKVFLFPIANSILYKKVTLPYHIFEPRYLQMVKDAVAQRVPIAVLPSRSSETYLGEICVAGLPHVLATYSDGRMDIYITGTHKCYLTNFSSSSPYQVYQYESMQEDLALDDSYSLELESLRAFLERWAKNFLPDPAQREGFFRTINDPELLVNYCAVFLIDDIYVKKQLMELNSLAGKIKLLLQELGPKEVSLGPFMPTLKF